MSLFKNKTVIGVSVSPNNGLEVAQIEFSTGTVLKYGSRQVEYNLMSHTIADLDIFKEELRDLLLELNIPKNSEVVLNIPTMEIKINDYPASLDEEQIVNDIEQELYDGIYFRDSEPCISTAFLPSSSVQFNRTIYTAAHKSELIEIAIIFNELGYRLVGIDTSTTSVFNALTYLQRINVENDVPWVYLLVEDTSCKVISVIGRAFVDLIEEKVSIGDVLTSAENYSTVISAVEPILRNLPSSCLYIVSKTNVISAEVLANKLTYSAPIKYLEANGYNKEQFIACGPLVNSESANKISLDVIGAAIYRDFSPYSVFNLNLFNKSLGDVYLSQQPLEIRIKGKTFPLTIANLLKIFVLIAFFVAVIFGAYFIYSSSTKNTLMSQESELDGKISQVQKFLDDNEEFSSDLFNEGEEISLGLEHNKGIYSYYTIVGTEIPKKLWLTHLSLDDKVVIEGQADNIESVYAFFRSVKDYNPSNGLKLQKLGLAAAGNSLSADGNFDTESILSSMDADFYEFIISNTAVDGDSSNNSSNSSNSSDSSDSSSLPPLDSIKD